MIFRHFPPRDSGLPEIRYPLAVFDLDGTLIDSKLDLAHSVNATRDMLGLAPLEHSTVFSYVGNGAPVLIRKALGPGYSDDEIARALDYFIRYYHEHRLDYTVLYPSVETTLRQLHAAGVKLAVLTNKPVRISEAIVEGLGVADLFFEVFGGNSFDTKKPDPYGLNLLIRMANRLPQETLMVGDSNVDIETARNAGAAGCGLTYGFRPDSLSNPKPDYLLDRFDQLLPIILE